MSSQRYKIVNGSESGHCCFRYTVVDTAKTLQRWEGDEAPDEICECFEKEDAQRVVDALNETEASRVVAPSL